jgi:hypothetical protein
MTEKTFPGFCLPAEELSAFSFIDDVFVLSTKHDKLVTYSCRETVDFLQWLETNKIRNVKDSICLTAVNEVRKTVNKSAMKRLEALTQLRKMSMPFFSRKTEAASQN